MEKAKAKAIALWRLAYQLRGCELWQDPAIKAAADRLDQEAIKIAEDAGFSYGDLPSGFESE